MITVQEATEIILQHGYLPKVEKIKLEHSVGRILAEDILADRDFPPFDRVMMDGVALSFAFFSPENHLTIEGVQAAGSPPLILKEKNNCIEIMTGAVLPQNTDSVVRYEDFEKIDQKIKINISDIKKGQNIHFQGTDRKQGDIIIKKSNIISPAEIGVMATVGKKEINVLSLPKIAIFSTGDELVNVKETPLPHQIRKSNIHVLESILQKEKIKTTSIHIKDNKEEIRSGLSKALLNNDVLILSGGVSKGKYDYIPEILEELGVEKLFHRVKQRPGKPFWFGKSKEGKIVFALPGNPVSTFMCTNRYFLPWLRNSMGLPSIHSPYAILTEDFYFDKDLQYFLQVKISHNKKGQLLATPKIGQGSGDLANLVNADGFLELPQEQQQFKKGECYPYISFR